MKRGQDGTSTAQPRKLKFTPKVPARKTPKPAVAKAEPSENNDDVINKELLSKIQKTKDNDLFARRFPKSDKKVSPKEVAFGHGNSTLSRSFPRVGAKENQSQDSFEEPTLKLEEDYVEPWDYVHSYYPVTLPLRRPYSGNPEILNKEEFGEASRSAALDESRINPAKELGLMEKREEAQMLLFQFPTNLPLFKKPAATVGAQNSAGKIERGSMKGFKLEDLPAGFMGKMMVYKSGKVKMKLGDVLFDISPGSKCEFAEDVAAINTKEKQCCILGELDNHVVVTPDVDALLDSIDNLDYF